MKIPHEKLEGSRLPILLTQCYIKLFLFQRILECRIEKSVADILLITSILGYTLWISGHFLSTLKVTLILDNLTQN